jgi:hypothetical protein
LRRESDNEVGNIPMCSAGGLGVDRKVLLQSLRTCTLSSYKTSRFMVTKMKFILLFRKAEQIRCFRDGLGILEPRLSVGEDRGELCRGEGRNVLGSNGGSGGVLGESDEMQVGEGGPRGSV